MSRTMNLLLVVLAAMLPFTMFAQDEPLKLLSGLENGTYFHLSQDIANQSSQPVDVITTGGSVDNFNKLIAENDMSIAFMQYDVLVTNKLLNTKLPNEINILFPLFLDEEIHLIARRDSKIKKLKHLKGKKVGIGAKGQGTNVTALNIKEKTGMDWENVEISSNDAYDALLKGEIDAYFYVGGMPVESLKNLSDTANIKLVNIKHKSLKDIYKAKKVEAGTYPWQDKKVSTYAVPTLLVVKVKDMSLEVEKRVNLLLDDITANVKKMQKEGHPKWANVYYQNQEIDWPYYYKRAKVE
jgi:TRAP transporter TAXI family solute receptor